MEKKTIKKYSQMVAVILLLLLMSIVLAACSQNNTITSAAVLNPQKTTPPAVEKKPKEIVQGGVARVVDANTKYYYIVITKNGVDPQTILGYVGERVLVDVMNVAGEPVHFINEELGIDTRIENRQTFSFNFIPKKETAYFVGDLQSNKKVRVVVLEK